jgi:hypothetical protein
MSRNLERVIDTYGVTVVVLAQLVAFVLVLIYAK